VGDTSLKKDTTTKSGLYARAGVRDYWVVNARTLTTKVYRDPSARGYAGTGNVRARKGLIPLVIPSLALRLADLAIA
jgi:Uma2 family endonuclease